MLAAGLTGKPSNRAKWPGEHRSRLASVVSGTFWRSASAAWSRMSPSIYGSLNCHRQSSQSSLSSAAELCGGMTLLLGLALACSGDDY